MKCPMCEWNKPCPCDRDRDDSNPVDMSADEWAEFYGDCERRTGMSFEDYLDNDMSMSG